jgi:predicted dehydrogenase
MAKDIIRWGIIGCGDVTEVKSGPGFQKAEHSKLVAVMRRNGALAEDYAKRHHVPKWYSHAEDLINDDEVDAIYIATPPAQHMEYTLAAAKVGKPIYVEKPMARNYAECLKMVEACDKANVPLFVAYYRRALPRFLKVKELIEQGVIGDLRFVQTSHYSPQAQHNAGQIPWRLQPELAGGGLFFDMASHTLDILDFLLGPIIHVEGHASNMAGDYHVEDTVSGSYKFESGIHGTGTWCFSAYKHEDRNEIIGSKGRIQFSTFGNEPIYCETTDSVTEYEFVRPAHIQQPLIQILVNDLLGTGKSPSTGITGARTNHIMDEMVKSYYNVL